MGEKNAARKKCMFLLHLMIHPHVVISTSCGKLAAANSGERPTSHAVTSTRRVQRASSLMGKMGLQEAFLDGTKDMDTFLRGRLDDDREEDDLL